MYKNKHAGRVITRVFVLNPALKIKENIISTIPVLVGLG
jgi:hypothetical protein